MRILLGLVPLVIGCGRLNVPEIGDAALSGSDDSSSSSSSSKPAPGVDFGADCIVGLAMDEQMWTSAPGVVKDSCSNHHDGSTSPNGPLAVFDGERGWVGQFRGIDDCITIPAATTLHSTTDQLTMSAWLLPDANVTDPSNTGAFGVIGKRTDYGANDTEYATFLWKDGTVPATAVFVDVADNANRVHGNDAMPSGWFLLTVVYDGSLQPDQRVQIYLNTALDSRQMGAVTLIPHDDDLAIGCLPQANGASQQAFMGKLDDVAVWSRAFSPQDVVDWYNKTKGH